MFKFYHGLSDADCNNIGKFYHGVGHADHIIIGNIRSWTRRTFQYCQDLMQTVAILLSFIMSWAMQIVALLSSFIMSWVMQIVTLLSSFIMV